MVQNAYMLFVCLIVWLWNQFFFLSEFCNSSVKRKFFFLHQLGCFFFFFCVRELCHPLFFLPIFQNKYFNHSPDGWSHKPVRLSLRWVCWDGALSRNILLNNCASEAHTRHFVRAHFYTLCEVNKTTL